MAPKMNGLEDNTAIPKASLLRVLKGVAVATKAPDEQFRILNDTIQGFECDQIDEEMVENSHRAAVGTKNDTLSFSQWCRLMGESSKISAEGVRQLAQVTLGITLLRERSRRDLPVDTTRINEIWGLIHDAIVSASVTALKFTVSRSAQGFLAVPLCSLLENGRIDELWRLHTWLPDGHRGVSEEVCIHAHQPFGQSWTLLGSGTDCTFEVDEPDEPSLTTHAAYECCYMSESGQQSAGASGYQTFQLTSTLFVFDSQRGYDDNAAVLGPKDGVEWVQPRDPADLTAEVLAQTVDAARKWEQTHDAASNGQDDHPMIMAYYNFFRGFGLLRAGRRDDAMQYLQPTEGSTPEQMFLQEPSQQHQGYVQKLQDLGIAA